MLPFIDTYISKRFDTIISLLICFGMTLNWQHTGCKSDFLFYPEEIFCILFTEVLLFCSTGNFFSFYMFLCICEWLCWVQVYYVNYKQKNQNLRYSFAIVTTYHFTTFVSLWICFERCWYRNLQRITNLKLQEITSFVAMYVVLHLILSRIKA